MRLSVQDVAQNFSASLLSDDTDTSPMHAGYPAWWFHVFSLRLQLPACDARGILQFVWLFLHLSIGEWKMSQMLRAMPGWHKGMVLQLLAPSPSRGMETMEFCYSSFTCRAAGNGLRWRLRHQVHGTPRWWTFKLSADCCTYRIVLHCIWRMVDDNTSMVQGVEILLGNLALAASLFSPFAGHTRQDDVCTIDVDFSW